MKPTTDFINWLMARVEFRVALALSLPIWLVISGCLAVARADESCPDGQVKYDCVNDVYVYGHPPGPNMYGVIVYSEDSRETVCSRMGCYTCAVCESTASGLQWELYPGEPMMFQNPNHLVFWGGCQVPCRLPRELIRIWIPLVFPAEEPPTM